MKRSDRALIELQNWVDKIGGGIEVLYCSHNPTIIDGVPHKFSCVAGLMHGEHYQGYGVTMDLAIENCYISYLTAFSANLVKQTKKILEG